MLLFKPYHVGVILTGLKTQTRRAWKKPLVKVGAIHLAKTQMLSRDYFAKLQITGLRQEPLGAITPGDAWAEGGYTVDQYREIFEAINGSYDPDLMVYVVDFEVIESTGGM